MNKCGSPDAQEAYCLAFFVGQCNASLIRLSYIICKLIWSQNQSEMVISLLMRIDISKVVRSLGEEWSRGFLAKHRASIFSQKACQQHQI